MIPMEALASVLMLILTLDALERARCQWRDNARGAAGLNLVLAGALLAWCVLLAWKAAQ